MPKQIFIFLLLVSSVVSARTFKKIKYRIQSGDTCEKLVNSFVDDDINDKEMKKINDLITAYNNDISCSALPVGKRIILFIPSEEIDYKILRKYILSSERSTLGEHHVYAAFDSSISSYDFDITSGLYLGEGRIKTTLEMGISAGWDYHLKEKWKLKGDVKLRFSSLSDFMNLELDTGSILFKSIFAGGIHILNPTANIDMFLGLTDVIGVVGLSATKLNLKIRTATVLGGNFNYIFYRYKDFSIITSLGGILYLGGDFDGVTQDMGYGFGGKVKGTYPIDNLLGSGFFAWANNLFSLKKLYFAADIGYDMRFQNTEIAKQTDTVLSVMLSFNGLF